MAATSSYHYIFKFIIVGESSVGKSCLLLQFLDNRFKDAHDLTIGVDFGSKTVACKDGTNVKVQIWDTAGQESFRSITRSYYRGSICALLVYDITRRSTFDNLAKWLNDMRENAYSKMLILLIANKSDLNAERQVSTEEGQQFAERNNLYYFEASAKTGNNVESVFGDSANCIVDNIKQGMYDLRTENIGIKPGNAMKESVAIMGRNNQKTVLLPKSQQPEKKKGGCC